MARLGSDPHSLTAFGTGGAATQAWSGSPRPRAYRGQVEGHQGAESASLWLHWLRRYSPRRQGGAEGTTPEWSLRCPQGGVGDRHLVTIPQGVVGDRLPWGGERQGGGGTRMYDYIDVRIIVAGGVCRMQTDIHDIHTVQHFRIEFSVKSLCDDRG